jgi:hypothetical protein
MHAPHTTDPRAWDAYVKAAPNFARAMVRVEEAVVAGVSFADLRKLQQNDPRDYAHLR